MKIVIVCWFLFAATQTFAQQGYVVLKNDSTLSGFLRRYVSPNDGQFGYEVWKTKTDKNPRRVPMQHIHEYAIKKDTFRVFHSFKPFHDDDAYFEMLEVEALTRGKINLYSVQVRSTIPAGPPRAGLTITVTIPDKKIGMNEFMYILEDPATGVAAGLPSKHDELIEALRDFFPDRYINRYEEEKGKLKYNKTIKEFVTLYNSR